MQQYSVACGNKQHSRNSEKVINAMKVNTVDQPVWCWLVITESDCVTPKFESVSILCHWSHCIFLLKTPAVWLPQNYPHSKWMWRCLIWPCGPKCHQRLIHSKTDTDADNSVNSWWVYGSVITAHIKLGATVGRLVHTQDIMSFQLDESATSICWSTW